MATKLNFNIVIAAVLLGMLAHVCKAQPLNSEDELEQSSPPDGCTFTKNQYGLDVSCTPNRYDPDNIFIDGNLPEGWWFYTEPLLKGTYLLKNDSDRHLLVYKMKENHFIIQKKDYNLIIHAGKRPSNLELVIGNVPDDFYMIDTDVLNSTYLWDCYGDSECSFGEIKENEFVVEKKGNDFNFLHGNHSNIWNIVCDSDIMDAFYKWNGNVESGEYLLTNKFRNGYDFTLIPEGSFVIKKQGQNWALLHGSIPNGIELVNAGISDGVYISMENIKKPSVVYGKNTRTGFRVVLGNKVTV